MYMEHDHHHEAVPAHTESTPAKIMRTSWLVVQYLFDRLLDIAGEKWSVIKQESDLVLGTALTIIGVFSFESAKYCDGNATDYLSCTRPSTYYYYGGFEIFLIIAGVFLVMIWFLKRRA